MAEIYGRRTLAQPKSSSALTEDVGELLEAVDTPVLEKSAGAAADGWLELSG